MKQVKPGDMFVWNNPNDEGWSLSLSWGMVLSDTTYLIVLASGPEVCDVGRGRKDVTEFFEWFCDDNSCWELWRCVSGGDGE